MISNRQGLTVFVGDVSPDLAEKAHEYDPGAVLLHNESYATWDLAQSTTVYTSLGDMDLHVEGFYQLLLAADRVIYCPPTIWSDGKNINLDCPTKCMQGLTENLLLLVSDRVPVTNIECCYWYPDPNPVVDQRRGSAPQLWIAGCSISHGTGVAADQRYGYLLAQNLGLTASWLTQPGSSIQWAADQICRSDIQSGDTVILGVTSTARLSYFKNNQHHILNPSDYSIDPKLQQILPLDQLDSQQTRFTHVYSIEQTVNFCRKCQAKLVLFGIFTGNDLLRFLKTKDNYFHYPYDLHFQHSDIHTKYLDLGSDNLHPGPKQHQAYAQFLLDTIS